MQPCRLGHLLRRLLSVFARCNNFFPAETSFCLVLQDVLVVTAPGSGAEVIPFLKTWVNLPMAIGFMIGYAKLVNVLATETLFYVV